jgi:hypothetical protein
MKKNLVLGFLLLVLLLAACQASEASGDVESSSGGPSIASQLDEESAEGGFEVASVAEVVLIYTRSGGIAGVDETYEFYTDGHIRVTKSGQVSELRVADDEVTALLAELEAAGVFELPAQSKLPGVGADLMHHTLTIPQQEGKPMTVSMTDGSADLPDGVRDAFKTVNDLLARASQP